LASSGEGSGSIAAASERQREPDGSLDPADWTTFRALAHRLLDDALNHVQGVRERPVWTPMPPEVVARLSEPLPTDGQTAERVGADLVDLILPYGVGNTHPRFFGWVHGCGTASGLLPEMMAAAMNANVGGRDHGAVHVERQVIDWCRQLFGFPADGSGLLVSGTSMATLIGLTVARNAAAGLDVRTEGMAGAAGLVGYASAEAHGSVKRAFEILGLGSNALRSIPTAGDFRMDVDRLRAAITRDRQQGRKPFCVIATAGTVNTGAIDDIGAIADLCTEEGLWLHVDGAFGALAVMSDRLKPRLAAIERADSLAFDFHKWMHASYDAGCVLVRRGDLHHAAFAMHAPYLAPQQRGLAGGEPWFCDFGPELSRGFRALKVWFALKEHGTRKLGRAMEENCRLAEELGAQIGDHPDLELLAPVALNIVCFRYGHAGLAPAGLDRLNSEIVADLQESGLAAPSTTRLNGRTAIRANITNHRTRPADLAVLIDAIVAIGRRRIAAGALSGNAGASPVEGPMPAQLQRALAQAVVRQEGPHGRSAAMSLVDIAVPTEQLLVAGGGSRLCIDPQSGRNAYGSAPRPRPEALALASSTASTISPPAFAAAEATRVALVDAALSGRLDESIALEFEQLKRRLLLACGFDPTGGVAVVLTPSGTDAEFAALHLARGAGDAPLVNILIAPDETGSGVRYSAQGRHFSPRTPQGTEVACGAALAGMRESALSLNTVEIRDRCGLSRPLAEIDAKVERLAADALRSGARCLVHLLDCSKTGLQAPSFDLLRRLREHHGARLSIVVDACQMRLGKAQLRAYLAAGFMVQITGSKFYMGPPFSGALLVPQEIAARASAMAPLPAGLGAYFSRLEWPSAWSGITAGLSATANLGLLLRWQAALAEMEAFNRVPDRLRIEVMTALAQTLHAGIAASDALALVAAQATAPDWPATIFAVQVRRRDPAGAMTALDMAALKELHALLNDDLGARLPADAGAEREIAAVPCHIGQPVKIGADAAALRLCIGARQIVEVAAPSGLGATFEERLASQVARLRLALRKMELVAAVLGQRRDESAGLRRQRVG
jgi:glutamate/tyrosine decarboxylase-like PLP-dependent enzyme